MPEKDQNLLKRVPYLTACTFTSKTKPAAHGGTPISSFPMNYTTGLIREVGGAFRGCVIRDNGTVAYECAPRRTKRAAEKDAQIECDRFQRYAVAQTAK